jgi:hypothetical protein
MQQIFSGTLIMIPKEVTFVQYALIIFSFTSHRKSVVVDRLMLVLGNDKLIRDSVMLVLQHIIFG